MVESLLLLLALLSCVCGMAWLALAMDVHWRQVVTAGTPASGMLRLAGVVALLVSLGLCLLADHPSIAVLVWVMAMAGAAPGVALVLAWRPQWLKYLVFRGET